MMFELIYLAIMLLVAFSILSLLPLGRNLYNQGKVVRKLEKIVEYHSNGRIKYSGEVVEGKKIGMHRYFCIPPGCSNTKLGIFSFFVVS